LLELLGLLPQSSRFQRHVLVVRSHRDRPTLSLCAPGTAGAPLTILHEELNLDDVVMPPVHARRPADTGATFRAGSSLALPVQLQVALGEVLAALGLPAVIPARRSGRGRLHR